MSAMTNVDVERLRQDFGHLDDINLIAAMRAVFGRDLAVVTSFGAESAVLLDLVARVDTRLPVIFLDTGKHFTETLLYRDKLIDELSLSDVRSIEPDPDDLRNHDPDGELFRRAPDSCCTLRKVRPLTRALDGFGAWITGRKRFQTSMRAGMATLEAEAERIKVNPLARWSRNDVETYANERGLAEHPLCRVGYTSIGCAPCTSLPVDTHDPRSGRWASSSKTECGIHNATWSRSMPTRRRD